MASKNAAPAPVEAKTAASVGPDYELVNKIGTNKMGDASKVMGGNLGDTLVLGSIIGICTGYKKGVSQYGEFIGLTGSFEWRPAGEGKKLRSGTCYLPQVVTGPIAAASVSNAVNFALRISARKVDKKTSPIGYQYVVEPLLKEDAANDPLVALAAAADETLKQLPAPTA